MSQNQLLSICIPTYNRANALKRCLNRLTQFVDARIEIIISNNGSKDNTSEIASSFQDERIKYYKNDENLGFDLNLIKCVEYSNGEYLFFLSDEDIIEEESLLWLLDFIDSNKSYTQILGTVMTRNRNGLSIYYSYGDKRLHEGSESLRRILFECSYLSGIVLKRSCLDLSRARSYVSCAYMFTVLQAQAMVKGETLATSRVFCYQGPVANESYDRRQVQNSFMEGNPIANPYHYLSRVFQMRELFRLVEELSMDPYTKTALDNKLIKRITRQLSMTFWNDNMNFTPFLLRVIQLDKIRRSIFFWANLALFIPEQLVSMIRKKVRVQRVTRIVYV